VPKPTLTLGASGKRAVSFRITCSELCIIDARLSVDSKTAKRLKLKGSRTVGSLQRDLGRGSLTLNVKLGSKARRALTKTKLRSFKATLRVRASGADAKRVVTIRR
jgi:hypothetical protein